MAEQQRIPQHKRAHWIHRKYKHITVERETSYGYGDSFPCLHCRATLERLDLRVNSVYKGEQLSERMICCEIKSIQTLGQKLNSQPKKPCVAISHHTTRRVKKIHNIS